MKREQFEKALEVNKELGRFKKHKEDLEKSQIQFGGCLIFHYNDHYPKVSLIGELYEGKDFFSKYMDNLEAMIRDLEKEFDEL